MANGIHRGFVGKLTSELFKSSERIFEFHYENTIDSKYNFVEEKNNY